VGRPVLFTRTAAEKIAPWVQEGARPADIAQRIGCTVSTLRVRCSQMGISLKRPEPRSSRRNQAMSAPMHRTSTRPVVACFPVKLNQPFLDQFERSARARGLSSAALAQALLEVIVQDGLYEAVLDERSTKPQRGHALDASRSTVTAQLKRAVEGAL
jgi:membrane-bound lytic murein transglycosylase B